jgi:porin
MIGPSHPIVRGDQLWFYYTGIKYRSTPEHPDLDHGAICLAVLRRDGFVSLDAGEEEGITLTSPFKLTGGKLFVHAEGGWSEGLDDSSIGSLLSINGDATGDEAIRVKQAWYQQDLLAGKLKLRVGKLDLTGGFECRGCPVAFDASLYANDERTQFLCDSLVNNTTIPFPAKGLGAAAYLEPVEGFYLSAGAADAQSDVRETGFRTAFHGEDSFMGIFETGLVPRLGGMPGAYRVGCWYDPQPKDQFGGGTKRDDIGMYLSFCQMVYKENAQKDDSQGLGLFARFGCADGDVNEIHKFWSTGAQYQGLLPGRDEDVLAVGVAQGIVSHQAAPGRASRETVLEAYYRIAVSKWLSLSPHVQYVGSPGGRGAADDAVVVGLRAQMSF